MWERLKVVPLVFKGEVAEARRGRILGDDLDQAVLVRAMVEIVGVAEQALVPLPVVLGAERIVNSDEAAAGPNVLAQRRLGPIQCALSSC